MKWRWLLPALFPSWRFFDAIGPSPRVEWRLLGPPGSAGSSWQEFRPRLPRLSLLAGVLRLVWNPGWNESLYVMRCAERVLEGETGFPLAELQRRLRQALDQADANSAPAVAFEFRIMAHRRVGERLVREQAYRSPALPRAADPA